MCSSRPFANAQARTQPKRFDCELLRSAGDKLRRKKRDRATQRATFRQLLGAVSGSVAPSCRIKLQHGDSLLVEGLVGVHRLAFFRRFLAGGFQVRAGGRADGGWGWCQLGDHATTQGLFSL